MSITEAAPTEAPREGGADRPSLAEGIELIGEYEGSGYREAPSLARRADGQVIQLTNLLYAVADAADGRRTLAEIAAEVSSAIGRSVSEDNVRVLVDERLRPLGVLAGRHGEQPEIRKTNPLLALRLRAAVIPEGASRTVAGIFRPLFFPPVVLGVLAGLVATDWWLFVHHGVAQATRQALYGPSAFLLIFALIVASAAFHEIGHATGCRYGGAEPGQMGCGIYLAWPAFYTDVTDAYRLGKRGRLRTDLGGVYFNTVVVLLTVGAYFATRFEPLLLLIVIQHLEIVHQLLPVIRLDGYYIVADLTGVPDLFTRIKPILVSALPWKHADDKVTALKPWVRVAVTLWVLVVVPLLLFELVVVLLRLPRILGTAWDSITKLAGDIGAAFGKGDVLGVLANALQIVVLVIPVAGIVYMLVRTAQRSAAWLWTRTEGRPVLRVAGTAAGLGLAGLLVFSWLPRSDRYQPITRTERGTLADSVRTVHPAQLTRPAPPSERPRDVPATTTTTEPSATTTTVPDTTTTTEGSTSTTQETTTTQRSTTTTARRATTTTAPRTTTTQPATTTSSTTTSAP